MAVVSKFLMYFEDGRDKSFDSKGIQILFKSVSVSADGNDNGMEITEVAGEFSFNSKNLVGLGNVDGVDVSAFKTAYDNHAAGSSSKHGAADVDTITDGNYLSSEASVDAALTTLDGQVKTHDDEYQAHVGGSGDKHNATAIVFTPSGDIVATEVDAAIQELDSEKLPKAGGTMSGALAMGVNKITSSYSPVDGVDLVNKTALDSAIAGLAWQEAVMSINLIGVASISTLNGLSPVIGDCYIAEGAGTPSAGSSDLLAAGSITEFDGTSWKELVAGAGGFVPDGVRAALSTATALIAPYTDATDDGKIMAFDGTDNTGVNSGDAVDSNAVLVQDPGHIGVNDNIGYVFEGTVPGGSWIQFTGAGTVVAGDGLSKVGNILNVNVDDSSIEIVTDALQVKAGGVTNAMLAGSIADGKLAEDYIKTSEVDDSSIEFGSSLNVKAAGITNAMLAGSIADSKLSTIATANKVSGSAVQLAASSGLEDSSGLRIASGGVTSDMLAGSIADGKLAEDYIKTSEVDDSSIEFGSSLNVKAAGITNAMLAGSIADTKLLQLTTANKVAGSAVQLGSDATIENSSGLQINFKKGFVNNTGSTIAAGKLVYIFNNAGTAEIKLADADDGSSHDYDLGITAEEIVDEATGDVYYMNGAIVAGFSSLTPGKRQYVSATAGGMTETAPSTAAQHVYAVGRAYSTTEIELVPQHVVEIT